MKKEEMIFKLDTVREFLESKEIRRLLSLRHDIPKKEYEVALNELKKFMSDDSQIDSLMVYDEVLNPIKPRYLCYGYYDDDLPFIF